MQREDREKIENLSHVKSQVQDLKFKSSEVLRVFYLNSGNELIGEEEFEGSVSNVRVEPKEIFREGLKKDASALILAHNHPSGKSGFTEEDLEFTRDIIELGEGLGLEVLDHVVVGKSVESMRDSSGVW
jgi:DNA repair protein RadC